jgi:hypothetical protein
MYLIIISDILPSTIWGALVLFCHLVPTTSYERERERVERGIMHNLQKRNVREICIWLISDSWRREPKVNPRSDDSEFCAFAEHSASHSGDNRHRAILSFFIHVGFLKSTIWSLPMKHMAAWLMRCFPGHKGTEASWVPCSTKTCH